MRFPMSPKGLWNNRFVNRIVTNFTKQEEPHFDIQNFDMSFHQVDDDSVVVPKVRNKATFITGWKRKVKGVNALGEEGLRLIKQAQLDSAEVEGEAEGSSAQQVVHPGRLVTHLNGRNISDDDLAMASVRTGGQDSFELSYSPPPALVGLGGEGASGFIESVENHEGFQGVLSHRRVHVDHHGKIWTELSDGTFRTWLYSRHPGLPELDDEIGLDFPRDPVKINRMSPVDYASKLGHEMCDFYIGPTHAHFRVHTALVRNSSTLMNWLMDIDNNEHPPSAVFAVAKFWDSDDTKAKPVNAAPRYGTNHAAEEEISLVRLPDVEPENFASYVTWLYTHSIEDIGGVTNTLSPFGTREWKVLIASRINLYFFALKYEIPAFRQDIMKSFYAFYAGNFQTMFGPTVEAVTQIFQLSPQGAQAEGKTIGLKKYVARGMAWKWGRYDHDENRCEIEKNILSRLPGFKEEMDDALDHGFGDLHPSDSDIHDYY